MPTRDQTRSRRVYSFFRGVPVPLNSNLGPNTTSVMNGGYIPPDSNDLFVWTLTDTSSTYGYGNTGIASSSVVVNGALSGSSNLIVVGKLGQISSTFRQSPGPFGIAWDNQYQLQSYANCSLTGAHGAQAITYPITLSAWIYLTYDNSAGPGLGIVGRSYDTNTDNHNESIAIQLYSNFLSVRMHIAGGSVDLKSTYPSTSNTSAFQNVWHHVGATYDGSLTSLYLDGALICTGSQTGSIDWNTANPWWAMGALASSDWHPAAGANTETSGRISDIRVANVARPLSWFRDVWFGTYL